MKLGQKFIKALQFAAEIHADQLRKGTDIPYIAHPLGVASIVIEHGGDEDEAVAALLHDTIEDHGDDNLIEKIRVDFGERVLSIVEGCSDAYTRPKPPWIDRKRETIKFLKTAPPSVRLVSAADKLHNSRAILRDLRELGDGVWSRFNADKTDVIWYYRSVAEALAGFGKSPLVDELRRVVEAIEILAAKK